VECDGERRVLIGVTDTHTERKLNQELAEMAARTSTPIATRIQAALDDIEANEFASGLEIGHVAPGFELPNALGELVTLRQRLEKGPVVLTFYRGDWCPYCSVTLRALQAALPRFKARGATMIAISPQASDRSMSLTEKLALEFDVLSDVDQAVGRAYRVQFTVPADMKDLYLNTFHNDLAKQTADGSWDLPVPATFVIDELGIIRARHVSVDYRTRMDPEDVIVALDALA